MKDAVDLSVTGLCKSVSRLSRLLFQRKGCSCNVLLFVGCLLLAVLKEILAYNVGLVPSKYYRVLGDKDVNSFGAVVGYSVCLLILISLLVATNKFLSSLLYISWRKLLTTGLQKRYFCGNAFYKVNDLLPAQRGGDKMCDNADQRITQDVERLCSELSQMVPLLIISPFLISYYLYQSYTGTGYLGPVSVLIFFVIATAVNRFLMGPVMSLVYMQEKEEGNFRYYHMLVRRNCEAGAFYKAAPLEERICQRRLLKLTSVQERLVFRQYWLNIFVKMCDYFASVLSYIVISFPIFYGQYGQLSAGELSALISKYAFISIYLFNCFTNLIDLAGSAANIGGLASRITEFAALLECIASSDNSDTSNEVGIERQSLLPEGADKRVGGDSSEFDTDNGQTLLTIGNLSLCTPDSRRLLISSLNLNVRSGANLLISGPSGVGKSSLFCAIGGLWSTVTGSVAVSAACGEDGLFIVPQSPYFISGSLADQVALPSNLDTCTSADLDRMVTLLTKFGLHDLISRFSLRSPLDDSKTWYGALSAGEAQRLCLVRALYHRPRLLLLDEATSQVEESMEETVYEVLKEAEVTVVTVGHRSSLRRYHQQELHLFKDGIWQLSRISINGC